MKLTYKLVLAISAAAFVLAIVLYSTGGGEAGSPQTVDAQSANDPPARKTLRSDSPDSGSLASVSAKTQAPNGPDQAGESRAADLRARIQTAMADNSPTGAPAGEGPKKDASPAHTKIAPATGIALARTDSSASPANGISAPAGNLTTAAKIVVPQPDNQTSLALNPTPQASPAQTPAKRPSAKEYTVQPGDTFSSIAISQYNDEQRWLDIAQANPLVDPTRLKVDQVLRLPDPRTPGSPSSPGSPGSPDEPIPKAPDGVKTYKIRPGDSLSTVAEKYYNDPTLWRTIYNFNRDTIGSNPNAIQAGMTLKVPPRVQGAR